MYYSVLNQCNVTWFSYVLQVDYLSCPSLYVIHYASTDIIRQYPIRKKLK
ncbi:hypothetical protein ACQ27_gp428 [Klebsiella phage K64-1]|nr:hypothetical protein ACQ27_gp428 [Klebsiella phage K64-1]